MKSKLEIEGALDRAIELMISVARTGHHVPISAQASALGIPLSSAYRTVSALMRHGLLAKGKRGHFGPGLGLTALALAAEPLAILSEAARTPLRRLARSTRATAHLGVFENDMVTYIVKEEGGGQRIFTREQGQLEAYCSAIGKVLLAGFEEEALADYLDRGPFVALTEHTDIDPSSIRAKIERVSHQGFAVDNCEVADNLYCVAAPVRGHSCKIVAAISVSQYADLGFKPEPIPLLFDCAVAIERRLGRVGI